FENGLVERFHETIMVLSGTIIYFKIKDILFCLRIDSHILKRFRAFLGSAKDGVRHSPLKPNTIDWP
ncbi:MAG TPA: hypothetical protein VFY29_12060, partial [Terriglobia bacterium]|nr:hypothetical protein [Terriglobia bacterium]